MRNKTVYNLTVSAMMLALGLFLPFLTGQIPQIGKMLLPMHIPVILCGFICGWKYGLGVGFLLPLMRSLIFGMPVLYPKAIAMAFELATYGFVAGFLYFRFKKKTIFSIYVSLISAMLLGRIALALSNIVLYGLGEGKYTFSLFISGAILDAVPGIILQLLLIPAVVAAINKASSKTNEGAGAFGRNRK